MRHIFQKESDTNEVRNTLEAIHTVREKSINIRADEAALTNATTHKQSDAMGVEMVGDVVPERWR